MMLKLHESIEAVLRSASLYLACSNIPLFVCLMSLPSYLHKLLSRQCSSSAIKYVLAALHQYADAASFPILLCCSSVYMVLAIIQPML